MEVQVCELGGHIADSGIARRCQATNVRRACAPTCMQLGPGAAMPSGSRSMLMTSHAHAPHTGICTLVVQLPASNSTSSISMRRMAALEAVIDPNLINSALGTGFMLDTEKQSQPVIQQHDKEMRQASRVMHRQMIFRPHCRWSSRWATVTVHWHKALSSHLHCLQTAQKRSSWSTRHSLIDRSLRGIAKLRCCTRPAVTQLH